MLATANATAGDGRGGAAMARSAVMKMAPANASPASVTGGSSSTTRGWATDSIKEITVGRAIKMAARGQGGRYGINFGGPHACGLICGKKNEVKGGGPPENRRQVCDETRGR